MISLKYVIRPLHKLANSFQFVKPINTFCQSSEKIYENLVSEETLKKFQRLLSQNTQESLEEGAELLASLELAVQRNQSLLKQFQDSLQTCPATTKDLIQKLQIVVQNVKQQEEENNAIQKRAQKELADCKNFSVSSIAREVLDVADSLSRCRKISIEHHRSQDHEVVQAIETAHKEIKSIFERYGIEQFDPSGQSYDPNLQEALATTPSPSAQLKNKVAYTTRTGYTIKGRLLRSAHVGIYL